MPVAPPHQGSQVFNKYGVQGWTWNWIDADTLKTVYGYGTTFANALNAQGYVEKDGKFYKQKEAL